MLLLRGYPETYPRTTSPCPAKRWHGSHNILPFTRPEFTQSTHASIEHRAGTQVPQCKTAAASKEPATIPLDDLTATTNLPILVGRMAEPRTSSILVALVVAVATVLSWYGLPWRPIESFVDDQIGIGFLCVGTILAAPLVFWMPRARASFFPAWRVPSQTYLLPESLVRLLVAALWAQFAAMTILALVNRPTILWISASSLLVTVAFSAGAWNRFRQRKEFSAPVWSPPRMARWCLRNFGWRFRR